MTGDRGSPPELELRGRPRPTRRLNKRALLIAAGLVVLVITGATMVALNPPRLPAPEKSPEVYNTERKQTAEGLAKLPKSYAEIPQLGPPLPGDIGRALVESEKRAGIAPPTLDAPFRRTRKRRRSEPSASVRRGSPNRRASPACFSACRRSKPAASRPIRRSVARLVKLRRSAQLQSRTAIRSPPRSLSRAPSRGLATAAPSCSRCRRRTNSPSSMPEPTRRRSTRTRSQNRHPPSCCWRDLSSPRA